MVEPKNQPPMNDELLSAYLDGELTDEERTQVEARLREDENARELLDQLRSASEAIRNLPQHALGYDLREQILSHAQVQPSSTITDYEIENYGKGRRTIYAVAAIAAALLLMFYQGGENPGANQVANSGDNAKLSAPDAVIRSGNPENTQIAGLGGLGSMFASRQSNDEEPQPGIDTVASPDVELIGDQLLGDAPLEHLHVHLKPKTSDNRQAAFRRLLEEFGVTQINSPSSADGERAQMVLLDAPLPQIQRILRECQQDDSSWAAVKVTRQSDSAPAMSFFVADDGTFESLGSWLSNRGAAGSSWALFLGRGTVASVPVGTDLAASDTAEDELDSEADSSLDPRLDAFRGNLRVLFVLLPTE